MKKGLLILMIFSICTKSHAQTINANVIEINSSQGSYPKDITKATDKIFFSAEDGVHGRELWMHDINTDATYMIKDIMTGGNSGIVESGKFTVVNDILYFKASSQGYYSALWRSDGTEEGTYLVKSISQDFEDTHINNMTSFNEELYFTADDGVYGNELWKSDGTEVGTVVVKDINPGAGDVSFSKLSVFGNALYFAAGMYGVGTEIWKTDGTAEGTFLFKDINIISNDPGVNAGMSILTMGENFYFFANDAIVGNELWKSDGTLEGTHLVKDIVPGNSFGVDAIEGIAGDDYILFTIKNGPDYELWKSDGNEEGTILLKHINLAADGFKSFTQFVKFNQNIYFTSSFPSKELWTSDGTVEGTTMIFNIDPNEQGKKITELTASDNFLIFSSKNSSATFLSPYITDGTSLGTFQLSNLNLDHTSDQEMHFISVNGTAFFQASSGNLNGMELWETDSTLSNTKLLKEIFHAVGGLPGFSYKGTEVLDDKMVFIGNDGLCANEPFITDGTQSGTHLIKDVYPGDYSSTALNSEYSTPIFTRAGNNLFFRGYDGVHGYEIFKTDGTSENTVIVKDIAPGNNSAIDEYTYFMEFNGIFYFKANDQVHGNELWRTDGTDEGTYMLKDIYAGSSSGVLNSNCYVIEYKSYAVLNGFLYFSATDATGYGIWKTDGTEANTVKVLSGNMAGGILGASATKLFIAANLTNSTFGPASLVSTDGTQQGCVVLGSYSYGDTTHFRSCCVFNNEFYYGVNGGTTGRTLMKSDGSSAGTVIIKTNLPDNFEYLNSCGNYLYFGMGSITGSGYCSELWRTDGAPNGTVKIADNSAVDFFALKDFTCYNSNLLYIQEYGGYHLYITDGIPENTHTVDINITNGDAFVYSYGLNDIYGVINDKIYFEGLTQTGGRELYVGDIDFLTLGINPVNSVTPEENIAIYPNPAHSGFNIQCGDGTLPRTAELFTMQGKHVEIENVVDGNLVKVNFRKILPTGLYLLKVVTGDKVVIKKIVVK